MTNEETFKKWLPENGVNGNSIKSYISYLISLEKELGISVEKLLKSGIENALEKVNSKSMPTRPKNTIRNYRAALNKYWVFLEAEKGNAK